MDEESFLRNGALPERLASYAAEVESEPHRQTYNATLARQYVQMGGKQDVFGRWTFPTEGAVGGRNGGLFSLGPISSAPIRVRWRDGPLSDRSSIPYGVPHSGVIPLHTQFGVLGSGLEWKRHTVASTSAEEDDNHNVLDRESFEPLNEFFELTIDRVIGGSKVSSVTGVAIQG